MGARYTKRVFICQAGCVTRKNGVTIFFLKRAFVYILHWSAILTALRGLLAQLVEQQTLNLQVQGSSPWRPTILISKDGEIGRRTGLRSQR